STSSQTVFASAMVCSSSVRPRNSTKALLRPIRELWPPARMNALTSDVGSMLTGNDLLLGFARLPANALAHFGAGLLVAADERQIVARADDEERAQRFPYLFIAGINDGDLGAGGELLAGARAYRANAAADGRAQV